MRHNVGGLSWEVTDNISLQSKDHDMYRVNLDLSAKKFEFFTLVSFGGAANTELRISFKCDSFSRADELIKLIIEGNDLELTPISINK